MSELVTSLREAYNNVTIEGTLEEKNLNKTEDGDKDFISGYLVVGISADEKYRVNFYSKHYKNNGEENKIYKGLETVMDTYVSRAEVLASDGDESKVDKVSISGKISVNDYVDKTGELQARTEVRANFVNRIKDESKFSPKATFNAEVYFEGMCEEKDENGQNTGRVQVDAIMPIYNGAVVPVTFFTTEDKTYGDIGKYLMDNYETGKTGNIRGYLKAMNTTNVIQTKGFGMPTEDRVFTNYSTEFIIAGGDEEQYLITDPKAFDKATIKNAMLHREEMLEAKKSGSNANVKESPNNNGFGSPAITPNTHELDF